MSAPGDNLPPVVPGATSASSNANALRYIQTVNAVRKVERDLAVICETLTSMDTPANADHVVLDLAHQVNRVRLEAQRTVKLMELRP